MRDKIIEKLKQDIQKNSISGMVSKIKIPYTTLYRIVNNQGTCTLDTWDKIEEYYQKQATS